MLNRRRGLTPTMPADAIKTRTWKNALKARSARETQKSITINKHHKWCNKLRFSTRKSIAIKSENIYNYKVRIGKQCVNRNIAFGSIGNFYFIVKLKWNSHEAKEVVWELHLFRINQAWIELENFLHFRHITRNKKTKNCSFQLLLKI